MPLYLCLAPEGAIAEDVKPALAQELTDIHCEVTDAPPTFVNIFYLPMDGTLTGNSKHHILGSIRAGRTDAQKQEIHTRMADALAQHTGIQKTDISIATRDVPASWAMEGGVMMPEPGEEEAWYAAHG